MYLHQDFIDNMYFKISLLLGSLLTKDVCSQTVTNFYIKNIFLLDPYHVTPLATLNHSDSFPELSVIPREPHSVQEMWDGAKQTKATYKGPVNSQFPANFQKNRRAETPRNSTLPKIIRTSRIYDLPDSTTHFICIPESQELPKALKFMWEGPRSLFFFTRNFIHLFLLFAPSSKEIRQSSVIRLLLKMKKLNQKRARLLPKGMC